MAIQLPDISTDAGILSRLIIAECENPGYTDYNQADGQLSFRMMQATVYNRLNNNPGQFGAPNATTVTDIITAPNQFAGFSMTNGTVTLSAPVSARIDSVMSNANSGAPGDYFQFVQDILNQVNGPVNDPLSGVVSINGTAVQGGVYGWRTAGSSAPGGRFFAIPPQLGGVLLGNQFYTLLSDAAAVAEMSPRQLVESTTFSSGSAFVRFLKAGGKSGHLSGYVKPAESDEWMLFSYSPGVLPWTRIRVRDIGRVDYLGDEHLASGTSSKVHIVLK